MAYSKFRKNDKVMLNKRGSRYYSGSLRTGAKGIIIYQFEDEEDYYYVKFPKMPRQSNLGEYEIREDHLDFLDKRKKKKKRKFPSFPKGRIIKVNEVIHNKLNKIVKTHNAPKPTCFLLGKNKKGIVTDAIQLSSFCGQADGGCHEMIDISGKIMTNSYIKLAKKNLIPCGIVRIGNLNSFGNLGDRGSSLNQIGRMGLGAFIMSLSNNGNKYQIIIESYNPYTRDVIDNYKYAVVK